MPAVHAEVSKMLADVPAAQWQSYLRYHLVDSASPALSTAFATEHFEFHNKALAGQKEQRARWKRVLRSEEHTSELQSLMRKSYAVFGLKKKKKLKQRERKTIHHNK